MNTNDSKNGAFEKIKAEINDFDQIAPILGWVPANQIQFDDPVDISIDGQYLFESLRHRGYLDTFIPHDLVFSLKSIFPKVNSIHLVVHRIKPDQKEAFRALGVQVHCVPKVKNVDLYVQNLANKLVFLQGSESIAYLTGDDDFTPSAKTFSQEVGIKTYVLGFKNNTGFELKKACTKFIPLDPYFRNPSTTISKPEPNEPALKALFNPETILKEIDLANSLFGDV